MRENNPILRNYGTKISWSHPKTTQLNKLCGSLNCKAQNGWDRCIVDASWWVTLSYAHPSTMKPSYWMGNPNLIVWKVMHTCGHQSMLLHQSPKVRNKNHILVPQTTYKVGFSLSLPQCIFPFYHESKKIHALSFSSLYFTLTALQTLFSSSLFFSILISSQIPHEVFSINFYSSSIDVNTCISTNNYMVK